MELEDKYNCVKELPSLEFGLLHQAYTYMRNRLLTLNEFCVICDEPHELNNNSQMEFMLKPTVCRNDRQIYLHFNI